MVLRSLLAPHWQAASLNGITTTIHTYVVIIGAVGTMRAHKLKRCQKYVIPKCSELSITGPKYCYIFVCCECGFDVALGAITIDWS